MVTIQRGLSIEHIRSAAELFIAGLGEKFIPILGDEAKAIDLIETGINPGSCLSAFEGGGLLGLLAFENQYQSFIDPELKDIRALYGDLGGVIRAGGMLLLEYKPQPKELYIEGIAVVISARGKGVGTQLINECFSMAESEGYDRVTLQVIDTNPRAQKLYERLGFKIENREKIWPINRIVGWNFGEAIFMGREFGVSAGNG